MRAPSSEAFERLVERLRARAVWQVEGPEDALSDLVTLWITGDGRLFITTHGTNSDPERTEIGVYKACPWNSWEMTRSFLEVDESRECTEARELQERTDAYSRAMEHQRRCG